MKRPRVPTQPKSAVLSDDEVRRLLAAIVTEREEAEKGKLLAPVRAARFNEVAYFKRWRLTYFSRLWPHP